jgi:uncharacterized protein
MNPLRVNTVALTRAGTERTVDVTVPFGSFASPDARIDDDSPVHVAVRLDVLNDAIAVSGTITAPWHGECRRCAVPVAGTVTALVDERYQVHVTDPEAFEYDGEQLDLEPMVRELVLLEAPAIPLCRDDCQGLCPTCGIDRNTATCTCQEAPRDPRWAALDQLATDPGLE